MTVKAILDTDILSEYFKGRNLPDCLIAAVAVPLNRPPVTPLPCLRPASPAMVTICHHRWRVSPPISYG
jgi:hypothetical protein